MDGRTEKTNCMDITGRSKNEWTDGRWNGGSDERRDGETCGRTEGWTDERTDGLTDGLTDGR